MRIYIMKYTEICLESYKTYFRKVYLVYGNDYNGWNFRQGPPIIGSIPLDTGWISWLQDNGYINADTEFTQKFIDEVVNGSI